MSSNPSNNTTQKMQHGVQRLLDMHPLDGELSAPLEVQQAIHLARELCRRARELQTPQERRQQAELDRMIQSPHDKATLMQLTDQAFRSRRPHRAADQFIHILDVQGVPRFFSALDRTLLQGFQSFGAYLPGVAMPLVKEQMQQETANVILPAERELLAEHLRARWEEGVRMNVNFLGEALLGEEDAERRLQGYLAALQQPEIEVISVKISTIYSQISALAREHTIDVLCDRLELLFRAAAKARFTRRDGTIVPKFVYLDMEEYRDKELTADVFMRTLDRPRPGAGARRHRAAGVHPRLVRHAAADQRVGPQPRGGRRRACHDPPRERREHGDGARRSQPARLAAGAVQDQARNRRQLPADAPRGDAAGEPRRRAARHRLAQPVHARLRPGARRAAQARSTACSSRCSKAWPTTSGGRCSS